MKTFISLVKENHALFSFRDYGLYDLATNMIIKEVIEHSDIFQDFYTQYPLLRIQTMDDYCLYLFYRRLDKLREIVPHLAKDEYKEFITQLADNAKNELNKINNGDIIRFINDHFNDIFSKTVEIYSLELKLETLDIIAIFKSGINKNVFNFLCVNYSHFIIRYFDKFGNIFEEYTDLFPLLFPVKSAEDLYSLNLNEILYIWLYIWNKQGSKLKPFVEQGIEVFPCYIKKLVDTANIDNSLRVRSVVDDFFHFLQKIKNPKAHELSKYADKVLNLSNQYLLEKGHKISYEIPVGKIIEKWKTTPNELKLLSLTHKPVKKQNNDKIHYVSLLDEHNTKTSIINIIKTDFPTDDYFTAIHQRYLLFSSQNYSVVFTGILQNQETATDYFKMVNSVIDSICEQINTETDNLQRDTEQLLQHIQLVFQNLKINENVLSSLCYGAAMYCSALTEKLLRIFYRYLVKDKIYIDFRTLGKLLSYQELVSVFGENHIKNLKFFLSKIETDELREIGENIRNSLAHLSKISTEELTPMLVAKVLWLFTDVLNTVFWYLLEMNDRAGNKTD
ncbi:MAG: hypothetical protein J6W29_03785 [Neisseriaceae bacterium]|nr:hypothetical protein [Neisseriaceae bacterium]